MILSQMCTLFNTSVVKITVFSGVNIIRVKWIWQWLLIKSHRIVHILYILFYYFWAGTYCSLLFFLRNSESGFCPVSFRLEKLNFLPLIASHRTSVYTSKLIPAFSSVSYTIMLSPSPVRYIECASQRKWHLQRHFAVQALNGLLSHWLKAFQWRYFYRQPAGSLWLFYVYFLYISTNRLLVARGAKTVKGSVSTSHFQNWYPIEFW